MLILVDMLNNIYRSEVYDILFMTYLNNKNAIDFAVSEVNENDNRNNTDNEKY